MALDKIGIAKRIAQEVQDGMYINFRYRHTYLSGKLYS